MADELVKRLRDHGYAPGSYMVKCRTCDETFIGDKRAWSCEPCALAALSPKDQTHE
jgi:hypothetical protein